MVRQAIKKLIFETIRLCFATHNTLFGQGGRTIAVFVPAVLGDVVRAIPLIKGLTKAPAGKRQLLVITSSRGKELLECADLGIELRTFNPIWMARASTMLKTLRDAVLLTIQLQTERCSTALVAHNHPFNVALAWMSGCTSVISYSRKDYRGLSSWSYTAEGMLSLGSRFGVPQVLPPRPWIRPRSARRFNLPEPYVCLHAGSGTPRKNWRLEGFVEVAKWLASHGYHIVLTGTASERGITSRFLQSFGKEGVTDLAGQTSVADLVDLLSGSSLVLSNDTGISHVSYALAKPTVVVFLGTDFRTWGYQATDYMAIDLNAGESEARRQLPPSVEIVWEVVSNLMEGNGHT